MAGETSVAVVGLGSRGLSVLERIVTLAKKTGPAAGPVRVEVIDPTCAGAGVHETGQPDYLLLNTTCAQVSMFPDECSVGSDVDEPGPNLWEWVTERGLRMAEDGFTVSLGGLGGRPIRPTDFLPRRVLGEYLGWFLGQVLTRLPDHVRVTMHYATAVDLSTDTDGGLTVALSDGSSVRVSFAFLTTGYTANSTPPPGHGRLIPEPYPLPGRLAAIEPGQSVAIGGFGLSAMDVMSCLTVGRGGRFVPDGDQFRYLPSGREPTLLFYSRSGVPCRARPRVVQFEPKYQPLVFTTEAIDSMRAARNGPLDFDADILPLVLTEMRIAYRRREAQCAGHADTLERALIAAAAAADGADGTDAGGAGGTDGTDAGPAGPAGGVRGISTVLDGLDERYGVFDALAAFDGTTDMLLDDGDAYQKWLADILRRDLAEGLLGFAGSPVKAALDILRDLRDTFRYAVDFGGLTEASLDSFIGRTVPAINRAVVGPQYERHLELLALMAAGVAAAPFGPAPTVVWNESRGAWTVASSRLAIPHSQEVDWLLSAYVPPPAVESTASPLLGSLRRAGRIRPHRPASRHVLGIDVDRDQHPLDSDGRPQPRLWVLGPLCEGATFYNNLVPSPNVFSRPVFDAHRCVTAMFAAQRALART
jgi:uncharacterized NAD(P)/FAD-binding protein YdhS